MNKRESHRPIDESFKTRPTPTSSSSSEPQGSTQQIVLDGSEQWVYSNDPNDLLNFEFMVPIQGRNLESDVASSSLPPPRASESSAPLVDKGILNNAYPSGQSSQEPKRALPKQLPEAVKYLVPASLPESVPQITNDPIWDLSYQQMPYENLPPRQDAPYSHQPVQQLVPQFHYSHPPTQPLISYPSQPFDFSNPYLYDLDGIFAQPVPYDSSQLITQPATSSAGKRKKSWNSVPHSPEQHLPGTRKTAQPKRRRQKSPGSGSEDSDIDAALCWRCKKYNDNHLTSGFCESCIRASNFNIAPSNQGTRRENLESLVLYLVPSNMEDHLRAIPRGTLKTKTWRMWSTNRPDQHDFDNVVFRDHFLLAQEQALSTCIFDHEYAKLLTIARDYQEASLQPNKALETACRILIECCGLYKCFINTTGTPSEIPILTLLEKIRTTRSTMRRAFREYQALALSPSDFRSRRDWLPSFLSACMLAISAVVYIDMMIAIPSPYKERIWGVQWHERVTQIRRGGYGMMLEVLRANTKNVNPLELSCWTGFSDYDVQATDPYVVGSNTQYVDLGVDQTTASYQYQNRDFSQDALYADPNYDPLYSGNMGQHYAWDNTRMLQIQKAKAERERDILLGDTSPEALQGMIAVKSWQLRNYEHLKQGENIFAKDLYRQAQINPIAGLWRIFEMR